MILHDLQNPLIEYIIELLIKQALPHIPEIARKALVQIKRPRAKPPYVPRVDLINRESESRTIQTILDEQPHQRILYFVGEGGVGKTRLLQDASHFARGKNTSLNLRWGSLLDLYHTELHSVSALQGAIVQGLDPAGDYFQRFHRAQARFKLLIAEGLTGQSLETERQKLNNLFFEEYKFFARKYRPVIVIDTLESLTHESDWVESLCNLEGASVAVREWLIEEVEKLENSVILLAGRPQPTFQRALELANKNHPGRLEIIELKGLTREDSNRLLALLLKKAPSSLKPLMERADRLWQITRGLPVQLALAVDLAYHGEFMIEVGAGGEGSVEQWGQYLVSELFSCDNPAQRVFFLLGLARKGMTADLLHYLEAERSKSDCELQLERLRATSVVKTRAGFNDIFLHDALYDLFDAYLPPRVSLEPWYEQLANYYHERYFRPGLDHAQRSQSATRWLYYELQRNPRFAFNSVYLQLRERALKGHELELDLQLRDELLQFVRSPAVTNRKRADQNLTQAEVDRDGAVRWIKRYLIQSRYDDAILIAETILSLAPKPYSTIISHAAEHKVISPYVQIDRAREILTSDDSLFWGHLLTYYGEALVYNSALESQSHLIIDKGITILSRIGPNRNESLRWLRARVLGRAYNTLGYSLRSHGHYGSALLTYQHACEYFAKINIDDERADTLNNIAFILALLGDLEPAKNYADQAFELRQGLGQKYPLALSYNTRGLIYSLQGQYELGRRESLLALTISEELEIPRGVGLACNALGYIFRKQGEGWKLGECSLSQATQFFRRSAEYFERAAIIFSEQVSEPIRLWEAYNEWGSLFTEWGHLLDKQKDTEEAQKLYVKAVEFQLQALQVARKFGMRFQEADTCDDLAKVSQDQRNTRKAKQWLKKALSLVPQEYRMTPHEGSKNAPAHGEAFWLILGKAYWQEGLWRLNTITKSWLSEKKHWEYTQSLIENFTLAAYYFECYSPKTYTNHLRLRSMADQILGLGRPVREVRKVIKSVADNDKIEISVFLQMFSTKSINSAVRGDFHE